MKWGHDRRLILVTMFNSGGWACVYVLDFGSSFDCCLFEFLI